MFLHFTLNDSQSWLGTASGCRSEQTLMRPCYFIKTVPFSVVSEAVFCHW